jgi:cytochrome c-type biogenesis protein CcmH/NrfG
MEPEAEQNCDSLLNLAMQVDPENVEALQSLASVRMSQQRPDEARTYVLQAWALWKDLPTG